MNAISHFKILKETCIDIEAYEIVCALRGINPNAVSKTRLENVDVELSI